MSVQVADLIATLRVDMAQYSAGLKAAEAEANSVAGSISKSASGVKIALGAIGISAGVAIGEAVKQASEYQTQLTHIQSNTGMTNREIQGMSDGIKKMASDTGAPLDRLAQGFMTIHNYGFSSADSMTILQKAMESALSTGDDVAAVSNVMGVAMHEFGLKASDAGAAMNVFHLAAQESNATLGQFAEGSTKATNMAATLGVSLVDVTAAVSTLVQSGQTVRAASDGITSTMMGIIKPTASATLAIQSLSHETGVNLVADFTTAGLKSRGLANVLGDVKLATEKLGGDTALQRKAMLDYANTLDAAGVTGDKFSQKMAAFGKSIHDPTAAVMSLFTNVRAFREAMLLTTTQADSFTKHLTDMAAAMSGKVDPTGKAFAAQQQTMAAQMAKLGETINVIAINLGSVFLPILTQMLDRIVPVIGAISQWVQSHAQLTAVILGGVAALGTLSGGVAALSVVLGPAAAAIGALAVPLVAAGAAAALLAEAWKQDWGGIQEITASALQAIQPALQEIEIAIGAVAFEFKRAGLGAALSEALFRVKDLWSEFSGWLIGPAKDAVLGALGSWYGAIGAWIGQTAPHISAQLVAWGAAFAAWVVPAADRLLAALPNLWTRLSAWLTQTGEQVKNAFVSYEKWVWSWWAPAMEKLLGVVEQYGPMLAAKYLSYLQWLKNSTAQLALAAWNWIESVWPPLSAAAGHLLGQFLGWIGTATEPLRAQLGTWAAEFGTWIVPAVTQFLKNWPTMLNSFLDRVAKVVPPLVEQLAKWGLAFAQWIGPALPIIGKALLGISAAITIFIAETLATLTLKLAEWGLAFVKWIAPQIPPMLRELGLLELRLASWIKDEGLPAVGRAFVASAHVLWDWISGTGLTNALSSLGAWNDKVALWLAQTGMPAVGKTLSNGAHVLWDWIGASYDKLLVAVNGWSIQAKSDLVAATKDAGQWLVDAGGQVLQGLIDGIKSKIPALQGVLSFITDLIPKGKGPIDKDSVLLYPAGSAIMQGLIDGINSKLPDLQSALGTVTSRIVDNMRSIFGGAGGGGEGSPFFQIGATAIEAVANGMNGAGGLLQDAVTKAAGIVASVLHDATTTQIAPAAGNAGDTAATTLGKHAGEGMAAQKPAFVKMGADLMTAVVEGITSKTDALRAAVQTAGEAAVSALSKVGKDAIDTLTTAMKAEATSVLYPAMTKAGAGASDAFGRGAEAQIAQALTPLEAYIVSKGGDIGRTLGDRMSREFEATWGPTFQQQWNARLRAAAGSGEATVAPLAEHMGTTMMESLDTGIASAAPTSRSLVTNASIDLANHMLAQTPSFAAAGSAAGQIYANSLAASLDAQRPTFTIPTAPSSTLATTAVSQATNSVASTAAALGTQQVQTATQLSKEQQDILTALKGQVQVGSDVQKQLADATTASALRDVRDQAHTKFLADEQTALQANNLAQYAYLQGQDRALSLDYSLESSQLQQVTAAQNLNDAAQRTLATDQARLQTAQQQLETAQSALQTAQQNLDTLQETQAGQQAINAVRQPYDALHLQQTEAAQKLTSDYNAQNLDFTEQLQKARNDHNATLIKQLTDQQQQLTDNYQAQKQQLTDQAQQTSDVYQAQMQQLNDQQQAQSQAIALKKAQDAVAAAQKVADDRAAAVKSAQVAVDSAQTAADKAAAAWQAAAAKKEAYDAKAADTANTLATTTANLIAQFAQDQLNQIAQISAAQTAAYNLRMTQTGNLQAAATGGGVGAVPTATITGMTQAQWNATGHTGIVDANAAANAASAAYWAAHGGYPTQSPTGYQGNTWRDAQGNEVDDPSKAAYYGGPLTGGSSTASGGLNTAPSSMISTPVSTPSLPGTSSSAVPGAVNVTVNMNSGAVSVSGSGASASLGQQIAAAVSAAIQQVINSQLNSSPGAPGTLPGAIG